MPLSEIVRSALLLPLAILLYGSGLLLWPFRWWRYRKQRTWGRALSFVSVAHLLAYLIVACCATFVRLGHFYYWFIFLIELNVLFTIAGVFAWRRDARHADG